ncbi:MAG: TolC family protein, partial [Azovibrio sp.]
EAAAQEEALKSAREALTLITYRYRAGTASLLDVLTAQTAAQTAEINTLTLVGRQFTTSAALITALGGIWSTTPGAAPLDTTAEAEQ